MSITQVGQQERSEPEGPHREPHCGSVQRAGNQPQAFRPGLQASDIQVWPAAARSSILMWAGFLGYLTPFLIKIEWLLIKMLCKLLKRRSLLYSVKALQNNDFLIFSRFVCGPPEFGAAVSVESVSEPLHLCMVAIPSFRRTVSEKILNFRFPWVIFPRAHDCPVSVFLALFSKIAQIFAMGVMSRA